MGERQFWKSEGQIITKTPGREGKGDVFGAGKRAAKKGEREKFGFANRIFPQISQPCLVSQMDLFSLIQNSREEADGEGDHESHPAPMTKRKGFEEPDECVLNFAGAGDRSKEDCITEDQGQAPAAQTSQADSLLAYGEPRKKSERQSWSEKSLKKKENKEKGRPQPKVTEELPERQS